MTLEQIAEKPITVATEEAISSFADSRQGRWVRSLARSFSTKTRPATLLRRLNSIARSSLPECTGNVVAALNGDSDAPMG
jgi:hypothetical protein